METKANSRKLAKKRRDELSIQERKEKSDLICRKLISSSWFCDARNILVYSAIQSEVDLQLFIHHASEANKNIFFPKVDEDNMDFFLIHNEEELEEGNFHVKEPKKYICEDPSRNLQKYLEQDDFVVLVPGVGFSESFNRLGYGKGYYDRFLQKYPKCKKIGIAFETQVLCERENDLFDIKMDQLITEKREGIEK